MFFWLVCGVCGYWTPFGVIKCFDFEGGFWYQIIYNWYFEGLKVYNLKNKWENLKKNYRKTRIFTEYEF